MGRELRHHNVRWPTQELLNTSNLITRPAPGSATAAAWYVAVHQSRISRIAIDIAHNRRGPGTTQHYRSPKYRVAGSTLNPMLSGFPTSALGSMCYSRISRIAIDIAHNRRGPGTTQHYRSPKYRVAGSTLNPMLSGFPTSALGYYEMSYGLNIEMHKQNDKSSTPGLKSNTPTPRNDAPTPGTSTTPGLRPILGKPPMEALAAPALRTPLSYPTPFAMMSHHEMNGSLTSPGVYAGLHISPQMSAAAAAAYGRSPMSERAHERCSPPFAYTRNHIFSSDTEAVINISEVTGTVEVIRRFGRTKTAAEI
ncbi:hypothetical protein G5714_017792 [Onychostoma macrolepis]|uniref:Uncharacterized protein n=1 Tax=Onychostoma macrolepis TaxID=369639 RepID=A0A7J6C2C3_9TELE|nr:hypothetical protein G5714_017792 [Onychostoma macrolepis]